MKSSVWLVFLGLSALVSCMDAEKVSPVEISSRVDRLPYYDEASFTPHWLDPVEDSLAIQTLHKIPSFSFENQKGDLVTEAMFDNKIYVADFFFTSCRGICPQMTSNMTMVQEAFRSDETFLILSHSVMPEVDQPDVLLDYAAEHGVVYGKWHLVTGNQKEIYDLGRRSYFVEEDLGLSKGEDEFLHTENFILVDKQKHIRGIYNGLSKSSVRQLIADVKLLKKEG